MSVTISFDLETTICRSQPATSMSFIGIVHLLRDQFGHGEHVDLVLSEDLPHSRIADNVSLIVRVL